MSHWTCQRVAGGVKCSHRNPGRKKKCEECGKPKPAKRRPAHLDALDLDYEHFIELNGGEFCAICGRKPNSVRRLDRDHCHSTGRPRGLLCARCNRYLPYFATSAWLRAAADYIDRTDLPV